MEEIQPIVEQQSHKNKGPNEEEFETNLEEMQTDVKFKQAHSNKHVDEEYNILKLRPM